MELVLIPWEKMCQYSYLNKNVPELTPRQKKDVDTRSFTK